MEPLHRRIKGIWSSVEVTPYLEIGLYETVAGYVSDPWRHLTTVARRLEYGIPEHSLPRNP